MINAGLLLESVSKIIRPQLLTAVDVVASSYGEILYLSWKESALFNNDHDAKVSDEYYNTNKLVGKKMKGSALSNVNDVANKNSHVQKKVSDKKQQQQRTQIVLSPNQQQQLQMTQFKVRTMIEDMIQTFLRECIHASESKYFKGLRRMIKSYHDTKRTDEVNGMLLRVYDPIIWRTLRSANAKVRSQAAIMFLDVFPLQHDTTTVYYGASNSSSKSRAEDDDRILQKQFDLLSALLKDPDHLVRANAVVGVCSILKEYWEVLPINTTHNILKFLINTLAFDSSNANVRYSLFVGLGTLLQQPLTHILMKQLLPMLKLSIHDKSEKVRIAFIKVLCQVKSIRDMHFYEIVSVDHLLERLAEDHHRPHVCKVMTQLLINSFYPQHDNGDDNDASQHQQIEYEQISRCIKFIEMNPRAAEAFYSTLHGHISIGCIAKLITMLFSFLLASEHSLENIPIINTTTTNDGNIKTTSNAVNNKVNPADKKKRSRSNLAMNDNHTNNIININTVQQQQLPDLVRLGLMRIIQCLLNSVIDQLYVQVPARNLISRYLSVDKTIWLLKQCFKNISKDGVMNKMTLAMKTMKVVSANNSTDSTPAKQVVEQQSVEEIDETRHQFIPVAFQLVASAKHLAQLDIGSGNNHSNSRDGEGFRELVHAIFVPTWKAKMLINKDNDRDGTNGIDISSDKDGGNFISDHRSVLARAVVDIAKSTNDEVSKILALAYYCRCF